MHSSWKYHTMDSVLQSSKLDFWTTYCLPHSLVRVCSLAYSEGNSGSIPTCTSEVFKVIAEQRRMFTCPTERPSVSEINQTESLSLRRRQRHNDFVACHQFRSGFCHMKSCQSLTVRWCVIAVLSQTVRVVSMTMFYIMNIILLCKWCSFYLLSLRNQKKKIFQ